MLKMVEKTPSRAKIGAAFLWQSLLGHTARGGKYIKLVLLSNIYVKKDLQ